MLLVARGNLDQNIRIRASNEIGLLASSFNNMLAKLREANGQHEEQLLNRANFSELAGLLLGELSLEDLSARLIMFFGDHMRLDAGAIYHVDDDRILR